MKNCRVIGFIAIMIFSFVSNLKISAQSIDNQYATVQYSFFDESDINISSMCSEGRTYLKINIQKITSNSHYTIERSPDGNLFEIIGNLFLNANQADYEMLYSYVEDEKYNGNCYYRITNFNRDTRALMSVVLVLKDIYSAQDNLTVINN
ncbi:MAG: hypothetical protein PHT69_00720 [Bacteroidales bacterium]|nr:hypothetical protein [Bacteroidales bacterium]